MNPAARSLTRDCRFGGSGLRSAVAQPAAPPAITPQIAAAITPTKNRLRIARSIAARATQSNRSRAAGRSSSAVELLAVRPPRVEPAAGLLAEVAGGDLVAQHA